MYRESMVSDEPSVTTPASQITAKPTKRSIQPWFISSTIREPTISAADGNIENKVECYQTEGGVKIIIFCSIFKMGSMGVDTYADRKERNFRGSPKG
jgi:hypothetical protein